MKAGDVLEWIAVALFVAGAYFATRRAWPALLVAGACVLYLGQCYANHAVTLPKVSWPRRRDEP